MPNANILIVDDEPDIRDTLALMLSEEGYRVRTACDGVDALKSISIQEPDLILLDMNMPKMGGIVFYHNIANTYDGSSKYPVIVLTARGDLENLFTDFKIDGFMTKPFDFEILMNKIHTILIQTTRNTESKQSFKKKENKEKSILVIDDRDDFFDELVLLFLNHHYGIKRADSSRKIIQKIRYETPSAVYIRLTSEKRECFETILAEAISDIEVAKETPIIFYPGRNMIISDDFSSYLKSINSNTLVLRTGSANDLLKAFEQLTF
jgi:DNA-binding response OmpR family regulator